MFDVFVTRSNWRKMRFLIPILGSIIKLHKLLKYDLEELNE